MKRNNKKKNRIMLLLILLLAISVGFALLSTTLKINGTTNISKSSWNVYWSNVQVNQQSVNPSTNPPTIGQDTNDPVNTKVTWSTILTLPGDFYEFTVDATNAGSIDAMITDIDETLPSSMPSCVNYSVTYADGVAIAEKHLLPKATVSNNVSTPTTETYKIRVEIDPEADADDLDEIPAGGLQLSFEYDVTYSQADDSAIPKPIWALPQGKTANTLTLGDELCMDGECFNFIKYDGNDDVVMLAKYNLKVGDIYTFDGEDWTKTGQYTSNDSGYNRQSSEARGNVGETSTRNGTVAFSANHYWYDDGLKPEYGSSFPADIYDATNYKTEPDFSTTCDSTNCWHTPGYSIAYYVEEYKDILETAGVTIEEARLLTYSEATDASIGCDGTNNYTCPTTGDSAFIANTTFWLGTVRNGSQIWRIDYDGGFHNFNYSSKIIAGVRPVIVVAKSEL